MNHIRVSRQMRRISAISRRTGQVSRRTYAAGPASPPNPNTPPKEPSRVGAYYKSFSYPVLKSFLIALFTYQVAYYAWLKLETIEEAHDKKTQISDLQRQLKEAAQNKVSQTVDAATEVKDIAVESMREGLGEAKKTTDAVGKVAKGGWWPW